MRASDAARMLGVHPSTVSRMVQRGDLIGRRDPRNKHILLVDRVQVEQLVAEIRQVHGDVGEL